MQVYSSAREVLFAWPRISFAKFYSQLGKIFGKTILKALSRNLFASTNDFAPKNFNRTWTSHFQSLADFVQAGVIGFLEKKS